MPVVSPTEPAKIRALLRQRRDGIGQIVVSVRRDEELDPFGVLCWVDLTDDGRYLVRTGNSVDIVAVDAEQFTGHLRPMVTAAQRRTLADQW